MYKYLFNPFILLLIVVASISFYYNSFQDERVRINEGVTEVKAKVLKVDNSDVRTSGLSHIGHQELEVNILDGKYAGRDLRATNNLIGNTALENLYNKDDIIMAAIIEKDNKIEHVKAADLYRQDSLLFLFGIFVIALLLYAGAIGVKALISFILTVFILWEVLVQRILDGSSPLITTTYTIFLMSAVIIFLVAGVNRKGISAFIGTICGLFITLFVTFVFGSKVGLFGLTQPYVNSLIFSGYYHLDTRQIFYSAIILGASGACMDIAMDIAASMDEVKNKKPDISPIELIRSGFTVGRHVIGTMATTLLLAYSGGYLTLLLLFKVKEPSIMRMINMKIVAAEIMRTLVGSIGLVLVAPITAIVGGIIIAGLDKKNKSNKKQLDG